MFNYLAFFMLKLKPCEQLYILLDVYFILFFWMYVWRWIRIQKCHAIDSAPFDAQSLINKRDDKEEKKYITKPLHHWFASQEIQQLVPFNYNTVSCTVCFSFFTLLSNSSLSPFSQKKKKKKPASSNYLKS